MSEVKTAGSSGGAAALDKPAGAPTPDQIEGADASAQALVADTTTDTTATAVTPGLTVLAQANPPATWRERWGKRVGTVTRPSLTRFAWLSIGAACVTIGIKTTAWLITGSVGLLSDAIESLVNLAAAIMALIALTVAEQPPDEHHTYGHSKAEYFSSAIEGALILVASLFILYTAVPRLFNPQPLEQVGIGVAISIVASLINFGVARVLMNAGTKYRSITLEADAHHLMTDVWTSVGIIVAVALVALTSWYLFDPIIAILVAINILWTGVRLVKRSAAGLMDSALDAEDLATIEQVLEPYRKQGIGFHALRTRKAGTRSFVSMHVLAPSGWSIKRGHDLVEKIEADLRGALDGIVVFTHLEPLNDPAAMADEELDRV